MKDQAKLYNQLTYLQQVLFFEKKIEALYITRSMQDRADQLSKEADEVSNSLSLVSQLSNLALQLYSWYVKNGHSRNEKEDAEVQDFFSTRLGHWFNMGKELSDMLRWFIPGLIFMIFFSHFEAMQQSFLDFKGGFAGYFVRQVSFFGVIFIYWIFKLPLSLSSLAMYQSFSIGLGVLMIYWMSRKYMHFRFSPSKLWIKKIIGYGRFIFGSGLLANISANIDQIMTARFMNPSSVAYYSVASRINGFVDIPSYAASEIIFPKAARASAEEGKEKVKYLFERMVAILVAFNLPTAIFIILFPKLITFIIAGHQYAASILILQLYMITGIFRPFQNQAANLLNSIGKPGLGFIINTIALGVFLVVNYVCLIQIGFYGTAVGSLITNILGVIVWYFIMRKTINLELSNVFFFMIDSYKIVFRNVVRFLRRPKKMKNPNNTESSNENSSPHPGA